MHLEKRSDFFSSEKKIQMTSEYDRERLSKNGRERTREGETGRWIERERKRQKRTQTELKSNYIPASNFSFQLFFLF